MIYEDSYEPVLALVDYFPDLAFSRDNLKSCLAIIHGRLQDVQLRINLIKPELTQLRSIHSNKPRSMFDIVGKMRYSIKTTKLLLVIVKKGLIEDIPRTQKEDEEILETTALSEESDGIMTERRRWNLVVGKNLDQAIEACGLLESGFDKFRFWT
jgi:hypothetical protein